MTEKTAEQRNKTSGDGEKAPPKQVLAGGPTSEVKKAAVEDGAAVIDWRESISMTLSDSSVLDCSVCFEPLTSPVYQSFEGQAICRSCRIEIDDDESFDRCLALEGVPNYARIACRYHRYGCTAKFSYKDKIAHESGCSYSQRGCPFMSCDFQGPSRRLPLHLDQVHERSVCGFRFNSFFSITLNKNVDLRRFRPKATKLLFLRERDGITFFIRSVDSSFGISCFESGSSSGIRVGCLESGSSSRKFAYAVMFGVHPARQWFQSITNTYYSANELQIPSHFYNSGDEIDLEICIWSKDADDSDVRNGIDRLAGHVFNLVNR